MPGQRLARARSATLAALAALALALLLGPAPAAAQQPQPPAAQRPPRRVPRTNAPIVIAPGAVPGVAGQTAAPAAQPAQPAQPAQIVPPPAQVPPPPATPPGQPAPGQNITQPGSVLEAGGAGANIHEFNPGVDFQPLPPGARITFNLQDADLPDLVRAIGNITGRRFIIPGKVRQIKTTIYSPTKVTVGEAYQAFLSVLAVNGMTVVPSGRYLKIEETAGAATQTLPTYGSASPAPADDRYITRIVRLHNITTEDAANVLGHFKSRDGDITPYASTGTLILTDSAANIRRMLQILSEIDVASVGEQIWVEPIHYALASELAPRVTEILGGAGGAQPRPPGAAGAAASDTRLTRILADDRSNSLIIVATQRMYLRVLELIRRLDVSVEGEGQVRVLHLQHSSAEELATTLNNITGGGRQGTPQGAARGTNAVFEGQVRITADKATNALVITSSPRDYAALRRVVDELDQPRRQVFIEAVVLQLSVNRQSRLGLNFHGAAPLDEQAADGALGIGGFNALQSITLSQDLLSGLALGVRGPNLAGSQNLLPGIGVSVPAFGVVLSALASSGDANILSTPHIIATDNSPADINVGQNVPLQTGLGGLPAGLGGQQGAGALGSLGFGLGGFAAPRQDVGTKIHIVPHINDSNEIRLEIDEEISEVDASAGTGGALGAVTIARRTAKTTVVVRDQNTVVIGGLIRSTDTNSEDRIPILGDIPILGALFRRTTRQTQRSNLLLFLTPYVIRDQSDLRRIFERKMRERQEFIDRYIVFNAETYEPAIDFSRTNGIVEEIRQSIREMRGRAEFEASTRPRIPPPHVPSPSIELPPEVRGGGTTAPPPARSAPVVPNSEGSNAPPAMPVIVAPPAAPAVVPAPP